MPNVNVLIGLESVVRNMEFVTVAYGLIVLLAGNPLEKTTRLKQSKKFVACIVARFYGRTIALPN